MKPLVVMVALLLSACASDQYVATTGSAAELPATLAGCKQQAIHDYFAHQDFGAVVAGGLVGGAVGGAVVGSMSSTRPSLAQLTEACMKDHGYLGTSN